MTRLLSSCLCFNFSIIRSSGSVGSLFHVEHSPDSALILHSFEHFFPADLCVFPVPALNQCPGQGHDFQAGNESLVIPRPEERFVGIFFLFLMTGQQQGKLSVVSLQFCALGIANPPMFWLWHWDGEEPGVRNALLHDFISNSSHSAG